MVSLKLQRCRPGQVLPQLPVGPQALVFGRVINYPPVVTGQVTALRVSLSLAASSHYYLRQPKVANDVEVILVAAHQKTSP